MAATKFRAPSVILSVSGAALELDDLNSGVLLLPEN
jgi:hypothetical protein